MSQLPDRAPDAVMTPRPFQTVANQPHQFFRTKFGPVMGLAPGRLLHVRAMQHQYFMTADVNDTLLFPALHTHASTERYDWWVVAADAKLNFLAVPEPVSSWRDRPEAVKFGWLRDVSDVPEPDVDVKAAFLKQASDYHMQFKKTLDRYQELKARSQGQDQPLTEDEGAELGGLESTLRSYAGGDGV